ncbi:hypothetical protein MQP27_28345 [Streptomyces sp. 7R015]|uniref:Uncharacterized protein n=1 Tax=Streptomyces cylindrosporus TaxID=2927583 RepID=A0ABS9YCN9_9ACTN|nr:hypothetical protein [Streptomyces cylindrosporus]MCI3274998.1 hypothetical protein [Streptomyces cylindrosporus]
MLRSVLVAAFSAVVAFGALSGHPGEKSDTRADSAWPAVAERATVADSGASTVGTTTVRS